jgi:integrase
MIQKLKYLSRERSGLLFYSRQIPAPLRIHYEGRILRRQSLKTHDPIAAAREALRLARIDDQIWEALRTGSPDIEAAKESMSATVDPVTMQRILARAGRPAPKRHMLSDALTEYLRKYQGRDPRSLENAVRAFARATDVLGNPALEDIKRVDARRVLDSMLGTGLKTASIKRYLATISAIFSVAILEFELDTRNPFAAMTIPKLLEDAKVVPSFSEAELRQIATAGLAQKIEPGLIATLQIETGCRVAEIASLRASDVHLDAPIPWLDIKEHRLLGRRLKTGKGSERALPLIGVSLAAGRLAYEATDGKGWLFPRTGKTNPASTVNRWLVKTLGQSAGSSHSIRHSMETRLVRAGVDQRIVDVILGHKLQGQGATYFSGFSLADLTEALARIALPL